MGKRSRGYYGVGIYSVKREVNTASLWRSAYAFGADFIFTVGARYNGGKADTTKAQKHIPLFQFKNLEDFLQSKPADCKVIGVECPAKHDLRHFCHPERAVYLLGAEDFGLPSYVLKELDYTVYVNSTVCLNVATAGAILMYDRQTKRT